MTQLTLNRRLILTGAGLALMSGVATPVLALGGPQDRPRYDGLRKTIAVDVFRATEAVGGSVTADGMTAMLTQALVEDGRFLVIEGGGTLEASAIVRGAVTKYDPAAGGGGLNISGGPLGGLLGARAGTRSQTAVMEIALRLVDASTGQIVSTSSAEGRATSRTSEAGLVDNFSGSRLGGEMFRTTPIGQAGQDAIVRAVEQIASGMRRVAWTALVVDVTDGGVYLNAGADRNVEPGMTLDVWRPGRTLTDPGTGEVLDVEMARIGRVQVATVRQRLSSAAVTEGEPPMRTEPLPHPLLKDIAHEDPRRSPDPDRRRSDGRIDPGPDRGPWACRATGRHASARRLRHSPRNRCGDRRPRSGPRKPDEWTQPRPHRSGRPG